MASNIPVIVQGNSFNLAIPLQIYVINGDQMELQDYTPDPTDQVSIQLKGSRRNYTYTPTSVSDNVCMIALGGYELADNYSVVVSIVKANGQRLRSFRTDQFFIVESSDDLTQDDIIQGLEENVIYLNSSIFVAGADGRGIESIIKTSTSGLVDTYTILYTDRTTSTFTVTNGKDGEDGTDGTDGRGITSIVETTSTQESGGRNVVTVTYTDGTTSTFDVYNGEAGQDAEEDLMITATRIGGTDNYYSMSYTWQELKTRVINGHDNMHALLILDNFGQLKMPYYRSDSDASLYFAADVREGENVTHYELIYGDEGYAILTAKQLDDVVMGKIDGTSFYRVTGYSGLPATPTFSDTAETGNENKIYVDILTDRAYRWNKGVVSVGESHYKLLSEELSVITDNEINGLLPSSTKKAISAKVLRDNFYTESEIDTKLSGKQNTLTFDDAPTASSNNPVKSGGVKSYVDNAIVDSNPVIEDTRSALASKITGVASFSTLVDKQRVTIHLAFVTANSTTLELTLSDGVTTTGVIPVYARTSGSSLGQIADSMFRAGTYMELIYNSTQNRWYCLNLDRDTTTWRMSQTEIDNASNSDPRSVPTAKLLRDNFYLKTEIDDMIGDIETLLASI